jgi:hypothetical protein
MCGRVESPQPSARRSASRTIRRNWRRVAGHRNVQQLLSERLLLVKSSNLGLKLRVDGRRRKRSDAGESVNLTTNTNTLFVTGAPANPFTADSGIATIVMLLTSTDEPSAASVPSTMTDMPTWIVSGTTGSFRAVERPSPESTTHGVAASALGEKICVGDGELAGDGFSHQRSRRRARLRGHAETLDVEHIAGERAGGFDPRTVDESTEAGTIERVRSALINCQFEVSQRRARHLVRHRQRGYRAGRDDRSRAGRGRLSGFRLVCPPERWLPQGVARRRGGRRPYKVERSWHRAFLFVSDENGSPPDTAALC